MTSAVKNKRDIKRYVTQIKVKRKQESFISSIIDLNTKTKQTKKITI